MLKFTFTQKLVSKQLITFLAFILLAQMAWSQGSISGRITNSDGVGMKNMSVLLSGDVSDATLTDGAGYYSFEDLPLNADYAITAFNNSAHANGITPIDLAMLSSHILSLTPLTSPYAMIAADANKSNSITTFDFVEIRKVMNGELEEFPNNNSWRFISADFVFTNPDNPFTSTLPEIINLNNITTDVTDLDFIAMKIGDLDNSATGHYSILTGNVYFDLDEDCQKDLNEGGPKNWVVVAEGTDGTFVRNTNAAGYFMFALSEGEYDVHVVQSNPIWAACVDTIFNVQVSEDPTIVDFGLQKVSDCPYMTVDISTPFLRRCFPNYYTVNYCNDGTIPAENAYVEVTLDPHFLDVTSTLPWSSVVGTIYSFPLGTVGIGECASFDILFNVDCDAEPGMSHCTYAHIYPDEGCIPTSALWNGGDLVVTSECDDENVTFTITNQGDDMDEPVKYVVIEDVMIQMTNENLQLGAGQSTTVTVPANGSTWRLSVEQPEANPWATFEASTVEGCGTNGTGNFSLGFVNLFALGGNKPYEDLDCLGNIASFDPNDKQGFPLGVHEAHFIEPNQDLEYFIRFQNTGTDTAFTVIVKDVLPTSLNPATFQLLGSSHAVEVDLHDAGKVDFVFSQIELPDSNVNELLSHGWVKFKIAQHKDLPLGTVIENEAAIYFDFNDPVITNRTKHTLGKEFLEVSTLQTFVPGLEMAVYPNPFTQSVRFDFKGFDVQNGTFQLVDIQGNTVHTQQFSGNSFLYENVSIPAGLYVFKIMDGGRHISSGKLMAK